MNLWIITYDTGQGPPYQPVPVWSDDCPNDKLFRAAAESLGDDPDDVEFQDIYGPWSPGAILSFPKDERE